MTTTTTLAALIGPALADRLADRDLEPYARAVTAALLLVLTQEEGEEPGDLNLWPLRADIRPKDALDELREGPEGLLLDLMDRPAPLLVAEPWRLI
ncbi:hypothetical protein EVJ50_03880 [Synechococcus sp. RSCCF101]|uniref:hypothetical protein n=1 Tax=Synechococcus sp. RSCCF101 TaxID=2511069 RepID=UPI001245F345|nr:hypothetical protein [Synechococcus sp. RSCCF101]QEY31516.1 hypothetical protein EVJ50_03880 [Synechococcus sp. RSCCF101]